MPPAWPVTGNWGPLRWHPLGAVSIPTHSLSPGRFGRRPAFVVSVVLAVPLGLAVALSINFLMVLVARLLFGAVLAGAFLSLYVARECGGGLGRGEG